MPLGVVVVGARHPLDIVSVLAEPSRPVYDRFSMIAVANEKAAPVRIAPFAIIAPSAR